jgi:hypothetical protein
MSYSLYVNRRFGGKYHLHLQGRKSAEQETSVKQVARLVAALYTRWWQYHNYRSKNLILHRQSQMMRRPKCFTDFLLIYWAGAEPSPLVLKPFIGLLYQRRVTEGGDCGAVEQLVAWMNGRGNRSTRRKPAPVQLSATDSTWLDPGSNPGRRGGKPATSRLSYGTTKCLNTRKGKDERWEFNVGERVVTWYVVYL